MNTWTSLCVALIKYANLWSIRGTVLPRTGQWKATLISGVLINQSVGNKISWGIGFMSGNRLNVFVLFAFQQPNWNSHKNDFMFLFVGWSWQVRSYSMSVTHKKTEHTLNPRMSIHTSSLHQIRRRVRVISKTLHLHQTYGLWEGNPLNCCITTCVWMWVICVTYKIKPNLFF